MLEAVLGSVVETRGSTAIVEAWLGASWAPLGSLMLPVFKNSLRLYRAESGVFKSRIVCFNGLGRFNVVQCSVDMGTPDIVLNGGICWGFSYLFILVIADGLCFFAKHCTDFMPSSIT